MIKENTKVWWLDGLGFKRTGTVVRNSDYGGIVTPLLFMIPVKQRDDTIIRIAYKDLHLEPEL